MNGPELSVVVPAYNEGAKLPESLGHLSQYLTERFPSHEIVVVDDGSSDGSGEVLSTLERTIPHLRAIRYQPNAGKGNALRRGLDAASGTWLATVDADLELPIEMLPGFFDVQRATGAKIVVGSKRHPDSVVAYPLLRRWLSRGYGFLLRIAFRLPVSDTQVGFKLFHREAISGVVGHLLVKRFAFDIEVLAVQHRMGLKLAEAPVRLDFSRPGVGRIRLRTVLNIARETAGVWYRLYVTHYYDRAVVRSRASAAVSDGLSTA